MIKILDCECKTSISEFTLGEFDEMSEVLNNMKISRMDRNLEILRISGFKGDLRSVTLKDLKVYISALNKQAELDGEYVSGPLIKEFEVGNRLYRFYEEDPLEELLSYDSGLIQDLPRKIGAGYITRCIAILFKDVQLGIREHYDKNHIDYKEKLFKDLPLSQFYGYLEFIVKDIIDGAQNQQNNDMLDHILNEVEKMNNIDDK